MNRQTLAGLVIVLALLGSAWSLWGREWSRHRPRRDLADELATWLAAEAARGGTGPLLILAPVAEANDPFPHQLGERLARRARTAGFAPVTVERLAYDGALEATGEPITRETFRRQLATHPDAALVVSLVGLPRLAAADLPAGGRPRLIVAATAWSPHLKQLPPGLLEFAIEARREPGPPDPASPLGALDRYFTLYRPAR